MTNKIVKLALFYLVIVLLFSCKNDTNVAKKNSITIFNHLNFFENDSTKLSAVKIDSLSKVIDGFYKKNWKDKNLNGGILIAQHGQIIYEKYDGYANLQKRNLINENTALHVASVSKVITATAILILIEQNRIALDQKVASILSPFPYPDVTIRTLLNHRSGIKNYTHFTYDKKIWNYKNTISNQDILNILSSKRIPLETKTNTHFAYCNTNYALLALIIEKITGLTFAKAMEVMIFEPLEMKNTFVFNFETDRDTVTPSYKAQNQKYGMEYLDAVYGDKNIYSTPRDLLKFEQARQSEGYLNPQLYLQIYKGYSYENKGTKNYGLGIRMIEWETGQQFYFHNGWWHGNTAAFITLPKDGLNIICLSNKFNRATYKVKYISTFFGNYPFKIQDED